jgi:uncharacterized membrane-anchored protein
METIMRKSIILISAIIVFCLINFAIYHKYQILKEGEIVLFEIAPSERKSKLQGDYMAMRYIIETQMRFATLPKSFHQGYAVIKADKDKVGQFVRIYQGETLANNEKLVKFYYRPKSPTKFVVKPDTFFYQGGKSKRYKEARYAIFHYHGEKEYLLIGLADKDKNPL